MAEINQIGKPVSFGYLGERGAVASLQLDDFDGMGFDSGTSRRRDISLFFPALPIFLPSLFKPDPEIFDAMCN
jgi:hypothetical protein